MSNIGAARDDSNKVVDLRTLIGAADDVISVYGDAYLWMYKRTLGFPTYETYRKGTRTFRRELPDGMPVEIDSTGLRAHLENESRYRRMEGLGALIEPVLLELGETVPSGRTAGVRVLLWAHFHWNARATSETSSHGLDGDERSIDISVPDAYRTVKMALLDLVRRSESQGQTSSSMDGGATEASGVAHANAHNSDNRRPNRTVEEITQLLQTKYERGSKFRSINSLANELQCRRHTVSKAIDGDPILRRWKDTHEQGKTRKPRVVTSQRTVECAASPDERTVEFEMEPMDPNEFARIVSDLPDDQAVAMDGVFKEDPHRACEIGRVLKEIGPNECARTARKRRGRPAK